MAPYYAFSIDSGGLEPSLVYGPRCTTVLLREYWLMRELGYAESCVLPHPVTSGAYFPGSVRKNHPHHNKTWRPNPKIRYKIVLESAIAVIRFDFRRIVAELSPRSEDGRIPADGLR